MAYSNFYGYDPMAFSGSSGLAGYDIPGYDIINGITGTGFNNYGDLISGNIGSAFSALGGSGGSGLSLGGLIGPNGFLGSNLMDVVGTLGGIGSGIMNYMNGQKMMGLARDQFNFERGLANRNLANQAKIINNQYDSSAQVAAAMAGRGGSTNSDTQKRYEDNARKRHVDGSWVG